MNLRLELARWNTATLRARHDYYRAPRRACLVESCHNLRDDHALFCRVHEEAGKRWRKAK